MPPASPPTPEPEPSQSSPPRSPQAEATQAEADQSSVAGQRWLWMGVLAALVGLGVVYAVLQSSRPEVPLVSSAQLGGAGQSDAVEQGATAAEAQAQAEAKSEEGGTLRALNLDVPTGFAPPTLSGLSFAAAFAEAAAYRGWKCEGAQVVLFSDARRAIPAVQAELLAQGYRVSDTPAALGEDQSWLARHDSRPTLFGSFSSGPQGRGNISVCKVAQ